MLDLLAALLMGMTTAIIVYVGGIFLHLFVKFFRRHRQLQPLSIPPIPSIKPPDPSPDIISATSVRPLPKCHTDVL